jgi:hypothetical protein
MPKRTSKRLDTVQNARRVMLESVGEAEPAEQTPAPTKSLISQVMAEMGRKGGKIGGKRRLQTMTAKERHTVAVQAAKARWSKKKKKSAA